MRLIIIGESIHGKVVADVVKNTYDDIVFLDNDPSISSCACYPVLGPDTMTAELDGDVFVAVGNAEARQKLMRRYEGRNFPVLIHLSAIIAEGVGIGEGSVVMAGTVVNPGAKIGKGCIVNTASSIDHDCIIGDFSHISVGAHLSGTVEVGNSVWIGAGATVSNNVKICSGTVIGAGAVVVKNIDDEGTYVGVPAKKMSKHKLTGGYSALTHKDKAFQAVGDHTRRAA